MAQELIRTPQGWLVSSWGVSRGRLTGTEGAKKTLLTCVVRGDPKVQRLVSPLPFVISHLPKHVPVSILKWDWGVGSEIFT